LAPAARAARWSPGHAEEISECEEAGFDGHVIANEHTLRDYYSICLNARLPGVSWISQPGCLLEWFESPRARHSRGRAGGKVRSNPISHPNSMTYKVRNRQSSRWLEHSSHRALFRHAAEGLRTQFVKLEALIAGPCAAGADQFDAVLHLDETRAVEHLERVTAPCAESAQRASHRRRRRPDDAPAIPFSGFAGNGGWRDPALAARTRGNRRPEGSHGEKLGTIW
jgi:hypothetical protein